MPSAPPPRISVRRPAPWTPDPELARALATLTPQASTDDDPMVTRRAPDLRPPARERITRGLFGLPAAAVMWFELVIVLSAVGIARHDMLTAALVGPAVLTLLALGVRRRGQSLYRLTRIGLAYLRRSGNPPAPTGDDMRLGPVQEVLPRLSLGSVPLRHGRHLGVCFDGQGWVSVLCLQEPEALVVTPGTQGPGVPLKLLNDLLDVDDVAVSSVQLLVMTSPATRPTGTADDHLPSTSYAQLNSASLVADRHAWLALRIDPDRAQDAIGTRGGGVMGAQRVLKRVATRAIEHLEGAGVSAVAADEEGLRRALAAVIASTRPVVPAGLRRSRETWDCLFVDSTAHVTWWLTRWPAAPDPARAVAALVDTAPASTAVLSLTMHRGGSGAARLRALVRLGLRDDDQDRADAATAFETAAKQAGAQLRRLDGEQRPAFASTLPLGGGTL